MEQFMTHPDNPQERHIQRISKCLTSGGVVACPTDSGYALMCRLADKGAMERIRNIRLLHQNHPFTLMCRDLSDLSTYAHVNNSIFRLLKAYTPGAYTFILPATREVPRRLQDPKRKTIGLRISTHLVLQAILANLSEPLMSTTLVLPGMDQAVADIEEVSDQLKGQLDAVINAGVCAIEPTTVVDLTSGIPEVLRAGQGDVSDF